MNRRRSIIIYAVALPALVSACHINHMDMNDMYMNNRQHASNGETIFRTGRNLSGEIMQDLDKSQMRMMAHACVNCHGSDGKGKMGTPSITYQDLTDPAKHAVPYNDSLIIRFLDHEVKSDGSAANTGVVWKMSKKDKDDLIDFLKTL